MARFLRRVHTSGSLPIALIWLALQLPKLWAGLFFCLGLGLVVFGYLTIGWMAVFAAVFGLVSGFLVPYVLENISGWISHLAKFRKS